MAESVISTLKRELVSRYRWPTRLDLELALVTYIGWYNAKRRHRSLAQRGETRTRRLAPQQKLELYNQRTSDRTSAARRHFRPSANAFSLLRAFSGARKCRRV